MKLKRKNSSVVEAYCHVITVTLDGVCIGNRIYWTLKTPRDYTLQITITQKLLFSVTVFTALLGNGFQQWTFLCSRAHVLAGWRPSHTNLKSSYVTTDGQSASLCWCQAPTWGRKPYFYYCQRVAGLLMWGASYDERTGVSFATAAGPHQRSH
jgi:hypothetical protein